MVNRQESRPSTLFLLASTFSSRSPRARARDKYGCGSLGRGHLPGRGPGSRAEPIAGRGRGERLGKLPAGRAQAH